MKGSTGRKRSRGGWKMPFLQLKNTELYYEVHGQGQPMVFLSETACDGEVWKLYQVRNFPGIIGLSCTTIAAPAAQLNRPSITQQRCFATTRQR